MVDEIESLHSLITNPEEVALPEIITQREEQAVEAWERYMARRSEIVQDAMHYYTEQTLEDVNFDDPQTRFNALLLYGKKIDRDISTLELSRVPYKRLAELTDLIGDVDQELDSINLDNMLQLQYLKWGDPEFGLPGYQQILSEELTKAAVVLAKQTEPDGFYQTNELPKLLANEEAWVRRALIRIEEGSLANLQRLESDLLGDYIFIVTRINKCKTLEDFNLLEEKRRQLQSEVQQYWELQDKLDRARSSLSEYRDQLLEHPHRLEEVSHLFSKEETSQLRALKDSLNTLEEKRREKAEEIRTYIDDTLAKESKKLSATSRATAPLVDHGFELWPEEVELLFIKLLHQELKTIRDFKTIDRIADVYREMRTTANDMRTVINELRTQSPSANATSEHDPTIRELANGAGVTIESLRKLLAIPEAARGKVEMKDDDRTPLLEEYVEDAEDGVNVLRQLDWPNREDIEADLTFHSHRLLMELSPPLPFRSAAIQTQQSQEEPIQESTQQEEVPEVRLESIVKKLQTLHLQKMSDLLRHNQAFVQNNLPVDEPQTQALEIQHAIKQLINAQSIWIDRVWNRAQNVQQKSYRHINEFALDIGSHSLEMLFTKLSLIHLSGLALYLSKPDHVEMLMMYLDQRELSQWREHKRADIRKEATRKFQPTDGDIEQFTQREISSHAMDKKNELMHFPHLACQWREIAMSSIQTRANKLNGLSNTRMVLDESKQILDASNADQETEGKETQKLWEKASNFQHEHSSTFQYLDSMIPQLRQALSLNINNGMALLDEIELNLKDHWKELSEFQTTLNQITQPIANKFTKQTFEIRKRVVNLREDTLILKVISEASKLQYLSENEQSAQTRAILHSEEFNTLFNDSGNLYNDLYDDKFGKWINNVEAGLIEANNAINSRPLQVAAIESHLANLSADVQSREPQLNELQKKIKQLQVLVEQAKPKTSIPVETNPIASASGQLDEIEAIQVPNLSNAEPSEETTLPLPFNQKAIDKFRKKNSGADESINFTLYTEAGENDLIGKLLKFNKDYLFFARRNVTQAGEPSTQNYRPEAIPRGFSRLSDSQLLLKKLESKLKDVKIRVDSHNPQKSHGDKKESPTIKKSSGHTP